MGRLDGKVAVITGSGRGIGRATALLFAKEGASVVVNDVDKDVVNQVADEIKRTGGKAEICAADVRKREDAEKIIDTAVKKFGKLDILVNNAGLTRDALIHKMTDEQWDMCVDISLKGTFNCTRAACKYMMQQKSGKIINVSSQSGVGGNIGQANYSAAKAGILGLTKACAKELGRYGINVNCILPAALTRLTGIKEKDPTTGEWKGTVVMGEVVGVLKESKERIPSRFPLGREGTPEDIAPVILFLASKDSDYVTGQIIGVDGGLSTGYSR